MCCCCDGPPLTFKDYLLPAAAISTFVGLCSGVGALLLRGRSVLNITFVASGTSCAQAFLASAGIISGCSILIFGSVSKGFIGRELSKWEWRLYGVLAVACMVNGSFYLDETTLLSVLVLGILGSALVVVLADKLMSRLPHAK